MEEHEITQLAKQFTKKGRGVLRAGKPGPIHNILACPPAGAGDAGQALGGGLALQAPAVVLL